MEGHAAMPDSKNFGRMREIIIKIIEDHIAEAAAEHDTEGNEN